MDDKIKIMRLETILKKLIGFPTVSEDQQANTDALAWMKRELSRLPLNVHEHTYEGYPSLVLTTKETKSPRLWLAAHLDVVPGSANVFVPRVSATRIQGRGTFDMKFAIAAYMEALLDIGNDLKNYDLGVMITCDEEIGGRNGVRSLLFDAGYRGGACFLPDGGEDWKFETSAKGVLLYQVESRGKAAHGARPWQGRNANTQLAAYLTRLDQQFGRLKRKDPDAKPYPTLTVGLMSGGTAPNQVAEHAEAQLDIRFPAGVSRKKIRAMVERTRKENGGISIKELRHSSPYENDSDEFNHRIFSDIALRLRGRRPGTIISHGSSDARHFRNLGIPVILIRPRGGGQHSEQEWIHRKDFHTYYHALRQYIEQVAQSSNGRT